MVFLWFDFVVFLIARQLYILLGAFSRRFSWIFSARWRRDWRRHRLWGTGWAGQWVVFWNPAAPWMVKTLYNIYIYIIYKNNGMFTIYQLVIWISQLSTVGRCHYGHYVGSIASSSCRRPRLSRIFIIVAFKMIHMMNSQGRTISLH